jgi:hypothetical protein
VAAFAQVLTHLGLLKAIQMHVRFARARFGHYDLIDFVVVLIGYVVSGEPTLLAFYERLTPFAEPFMALFGRASASPSLDALPPSRLAWIKRQWKRFVRYAQEDLLARKPFAFPGGLFDRTGAQWVVADGDGTRATPSPRALPQTDALPAPHRRFDQVCAPGYQGREVRRNRPNPYGPAPGTYTSVFRHGCRDQAMGITEANCDGLLR